jgi:hypothetical protein
MGMSYGHELAIRYIEACLQGRILHNSLHHSRNDADARCCDTFGRPSSFSEWHR